MSGHILPPHNTKADEYGAWHPPNLCSIIHSASGKLQPQFHFPIDPTYGSKLWPPRQKSINWFWGFHRRSDILYASLGFIFLLLFKKHAAAFLDRQPQRTLHPPCLILWTSEPLKIGVVNKYFVHKSCIRLTVNERKRLSQPGRSDHTNSDKARANSFSGGLENWATLTCIWSIVGGKHANLLKQTGLPLGASSSPRRDFIPQAVARRVLFRQIKRVRKCYHCFSAPSRESLGEFGW